MSAGKPGWEVVELIDWQKAMGLEQEDMGRVNKNKVRLAVEAIQAELRVGGAGNLGNTEMVSSHVNLNESLDFVVKKYNLQKEGVD